MAVTQKINAHLETSKVRLLLSRENLEGRTLPDTVRSNESEHLSGPWGRETVKLKRVGRVTVSDLRFEVCWQVDDVDGLEGAPVKATRVSFYSMLLRRTPVATSYSLLGADTTSDTELLRDKGDLLRRVDLDTELACGRIAKQRLWSALPSHLRCSAPEMPLTHANDGARLLAFLTALLGLAAVGVDLLRITKACGQRKKKGPQEQRLDVPKRYG